MVIFLLSATELVMAQSADFSGTWVIKDQQGVLGKLYSNGVPKEMKAIQTEDNITIEKVTAGGSGDVTTTEAPGLMGSVLNRSARQNGKKS